MDLRERTIEIAELRDVSLNSSHVFPDFVHCRSELAVTATGDENVRAFACEPLCCRQPDAAIATGDERDLSFELTHLFSIPTEAAGPDAGIQRWPHRRVPMDYRPGSQNGLRHRRIILGLATETILPGVTLLSRIIAHIRARSLLRVFCG